MISNVYNYYLSQYAAKPSSRFDSHKKSELRNVYNKMVSINRKSPLYKLNLSEDMQKLAIDIKENAIDLKDISAELSEAESGMNEVKHKAGSSNEDALTVRYTGDEKETADGFSIDIKQLATNQVNTGHFLQPQSKYLAAGDYSFDINISDVTYELQFHVDNQDTTKDVQEKIAQLINRSGIGMRAQIENDALGNTAISVSSGQTGIRNMKSLIFTVSDDENSRNKGAVEYLGLNRTMQYPANAIFAINGEVRSSADNHITVNKIFDLEFKNTTTKPVDVFLEEDTDSIAKEVSEFVGGYNRIVDFARSASKKFEGGERLYKEFERIAKSYNAVLEENGFIVKEDGKLELNEEAQKRLGSREEVSKVLSGLEDFRSSVSRKTESMISNPIAYIDKKLVVYKHPVKNFASPYNSSVYAGIMFDGYY